MEENNAIAIVFSRNAFYRRLYRYLLLACLWMGMIIIALLSLIYLMLKNPSPPIFFASNEAGYLIPIVPITKPNMSNDQVIEWVIEAVQTAMSYDFINYRAQLQSSRKFFTHYGSVNYMKALTLANNLPTLLANKQVVMAHVVDKPTIIAEGLLGGAYAWKFSMQVLVTYLEPPYSSPKYVNPLKVEVVVQRQPILQSYRGLAIVQLIATFAGVTSEELSATSTG